MIAKTLLIFTQTIVAVSLAMSGYLHIDNNFYFLSTIYSYQIVSENTGILLATVLPPFQIVIALGLLFDRRGLPFIFLLAAFLFLMFTIAQASAWYRELNISCGCFGASYDNPIGAKSISLAVAGLIISLFGAFLSFKTRPYQESKP